MPLNREKINGIKSCFSLSHTQPRAAFEYKFQWIFIKILSAIFVPRKWMCKLGEVGECG